MKYWWHIYMVRLQSRDGSKRHYGNTKELYAGITRRGIGIRMGDYLFHRGKGYVNRCWKDAIKVPVYVEYFFGTRTEAERREKEIKGMDVEKKKGLIWSEKNVLVGYKPLSHLVLKQNGQSGEIVVKIE